MKNSRCLLTDVYNGISEWGWVGVDLFFVLSGFLITSLLLVERTVSGGISIRNFYWRRLLRIFPLYYLVLFVAFIVIPVASGALSHIDSFLRFISRELSQFLLLVGNYTLTFRPHKIFEFEALLSLNPRWISVLLLPLWSLCIEEQFYLFWPWIVKKAGAARGLATFICIAIAMTVLFRFCILNFMINQSGTGAIHHNWYYINTFCRLDPIMIGALIAVVARSQQIKVSGSQGSIGVTILLAGFFSIVFCIPSIKTVTLFHTATLLVTGLLGGLLLVLSIGWNPLRRLLSINLVGSFGRRTYCLYLTHLFCIAIVFSVFPGASIADVVLRAFLALAIGLGIAQLTWLLIERPCVRLKWRFSPAYFNDRQLRTKARSILAPPAM